jgi:hypothetical protein
MTSITTSKAITTSKDVLNVVKTKKTTTTTTKLKKVASEWGLEYIDMYNEWGAHSCSKDFLTPLFDLSRMVTYEIGREILAGCREARSKISTRNAKNWAISDVHLAIARAEELGYKRDSGSTTRSRRTASTSQHSQVHEAGSDGGNQVKENDDCIRSNWAQRCYQKPVATVWRCSRYIICLDRHMRARLQKYKDHAVHAPSSLLSFAPYACPIHVRKHNTLFSTCS